MTAFIAELVGTMLLILLGLGVVANVVLDKTKGNGAGVILITLAWGLAVYVGVVVAGPYSGAHLNPAVTIGLAIGGKFAWSSVLPYCIAQIIGAAIGAAMVGIMYIDHFRATEDLNMKLGVFATGAEIKNPIPNLLSEAFGTFVLLMGVFYISAPSIDTSLTSDIKIGLGSVGALPIALFVVAVGMSLGGTTGYAINPTRDLIPRLMHSILPIGEKRDGDWGYAWVPLFGPLLGASAAAGLFLAIG